MLLQCGNELAQRRVHQLLHQVHPTDHLNHRCVEAKEPLVVSVVGGTRAFPLGLLGRLALVRLARVEHAVVILLLRSGGFGGLTLGRHGEDRGRGVEHAGRVEWWEVAGEGGLGKARVEQWAETRESPE